MTAKKEKSAAVISVLEIADGLVASCNTCQEVLDEGRYVLLYELEHFKFLIGEKEKRKCLCGEEMNIPLFFENRTSASNTQEKVIIDADESNGIPTFPFIQFSQVVHTRLQ